MANTITTLEDKNKKEILKDIQLLTEMNARFDEKMKSYAEKLTENNQRISSFFDSHNSLSNRVTIIETKNGTDDVVKEIKQKLESSVERIFKLEANQLEKNVYELQDELDDFKKESNSLEKRIHKLEDASINLWSRTKYIFDFVSKGVWIIIVSWLLFKFGLNPPPGP